MRYESLRVENNDFPFELNQNIFHTHYLKKIKQKLFADVLLNIGKTKCCRIVSRAYPMWVQNFLKFLVIPSKIIIRLLEINEMNLLVIYYTRIPLLIDGLYLSAHLLSIRYK